MPREKNDTQLNVRIPATLMQALRAESSRTGAPVSEIVRRAIVKYLESRKAEGKERVDE